jgi:uncharacterized alpha/beta hydrolase family protein
MNLYFEKIYNKGNKMKNSIIKISEILIIIFFIGVVLFSTKLQLSKNMKENIKKKNLNSEITTINVTGIELGKETRA